MPEVELSMGTIEYEDTGGDGPPVVMLHGLGMGGSVWRHVVEGLREDHRCVVPTLPLGSHRRPMRPDADLTLRGHAGLVAEFLDGAGLDQVTLVQNDINIATPLVNAHPDRVARLVLVACEAFDNYPPGLPGKMLGVAARIPGGLKAAYTTLRLRPMRRLPPFAMLSKRPIPDAVVDAWLQPMLANPRVMRDLRKYVLSAETSVMVEECAKLRGFDKPALVVWAPEDRMMPAGHGRRLAELLPRGELVEIPDSYTLIPEDRPDELVAALRTFIEKAA